MNTNPTVKVIIPFRLREGADMRRAANLDTVMAWWWLHGFDPVVVDDGLTGDAQFNRHRAYNKAVSGNDAEVYVFTEADMLIRPEQIITATRLAARVPGLVVPFTEYRYLSDASTEVVRETFADLPSRQLANIIGRGWPLTVEPESVMKNGKSIGAVNVISAEALEITGGFTEATHGNWFDDRIIEEGFAHLCGRRTGFIAGPAVHLYHLPGWTGDHLSDEDRAATAHNKQILWKMRSDVRQRKTEQVKALMEVRS